VCGRLHEMTGLVEPSHRHDDAPPPRAATLIMDWTEYLAAISVRPRLPTRLDLAQNTPDHPLAANLPSR
jgi:hypothetical protein